MENAAQALLEEEPPEVDANNIDWEATELYEETFDDFSKKVYAQAGSELLRLLDNPNKDNPNGENPELANLDLQIIAREKDEGIIGKDLHFNLDKFTDSYRQFREFREKSKTDPTDAKNGMNQIIDTLIKLNKDSGYPEDMGVPLRPTTEIEGPDPSSSGKVTTVEPTPGYTCRGEKIHACRSIRGNIYKYYVFVKRGENEDFCVVMTAEEIGLDAAEAYHNHTELVVDVNGGNTRTVYRRRDKAKFGGVLHVACKGHDRKIIPLEETSKKPPRPPTDVEIMYDIAKAWVTFSQLVTLCGRNDALSYITAYYVRFKETPPWEKQPRLILKVIEDNRPSNAGHEGAQKYEELMQNLMQSTKEMHDKMEKERKQMQQEREQYMAIISAMTQKVQAS